MATFKNTIAIAYDFDGTLAPGNMQEHNFIPDMKMDIPSFWQEANEIAEKNDMDEVLAYMYLMLEKAKEQNFRIRKEDFQKYGAQIDFYKGVEEYFERINKYDLGIFDYLIPYNKLGTTVIVHIRNQIFINIITQTFNVKQRRNRLAVICQNHDIDSVIVIGMCT